MSYIYSISCNTRRMCVQSSSCVVVERKITYIKSAYTPHIIKKGSFFPTNERGTEGAKTKQERRTAPG